MNKRRTNRMFALLLSIVMVLGCLSASMPIFALAASDWVQVSGTSYEYTPVTIYVQQSSLTSGQTYLIAIQTNNAILRTNLSARTVTRSNAGQTAYYSGNTASASLYTAPNAYIVDETNTAYSDSEFTWRNGNTLYNSASKQYLTVNGTTLQMNSSSSNTWSLNSNRLRTTISGTTYNLRYRNSSYSLNTGTNYATVYAYQKSTVYKRTSVTTSGYYKNAGPSEYTVYKNEDFTAADVENGIQLQYKATSSSTNITSLNLGDNNSTLTWDKTFTTATPGTYTATLKVGSTTVDTITVTVSSEEAPESTYTKYTPKSSGQIFEEGTYVFWNEGHTRLMLGKAAPDGEGIASSSTNDFAISSDVLTTNLKKAEFTVSVANAANNTYYIQTSDGRYVSVGSDMTLEAATLSPTPTAVKVITSGGKIAIGNTSTDRYLNCYDGDLVFGVWDLGMDDENNRFVAYKLSAGVFYYDGKTSFTVPKGEPFDEEMILRAVSVIHKESEEAEEYETLTINDPRITLRWNETVDTSVRGSYTATVYANGEELQTLTVTVIDDGPIYTEKMNDPSTSSIEDEFEGTSDDDGMVKADKSVKYRGDDYNAFNYYDEDQFSVTLSAMGQAYPIKTVETVQRQTHADVVFVLDVSGSMGRYTMAGSTQTREEGTAIALNTAINKLLEADPETRIGIVCYGNSYYPNGLYLPIDKYTLPEGDTDYVTYAKTNYFDSYIIPEGTVVVSGTERSSGNRYLYFDGTTSTTNTTSKARVAIGQNGAYTYYAANSTSGTSGTLADHEYVELNGYVLYRSGTTYTIYSGVQHETVTVHEKKTVTESNISISGTSVTGATKLTLQNGEVLYAYRYSNNFRITRGNTSSDSSLLTVSGTNSLVINGTNYTFTKVDTTHITISYEMNTTSQKTVIKGETVNIPQVSGTTDKLFATSGRLTNSKGEVMAPTSYIVNNDGTFTQAGLKAAENMFAQAENTENRIPVVVLITDGTPTFYDLDYENVPLMNDTTSGSGNGTTRKGGNGNVNNCTNQMGYLTVRTAMSVKSAVSKMYPDYNAMFYSIGPGVDYLFGQTVLSPSEENLALCQGNTTTNEQSGNGTPDGLRTMLYNNLSDAELDYVDYADWSMAGNMSTPELEEAFSRIVKNITDVPRPITTYEYNDEYILTRNAYAYFTDTLGEGMEIRDNFEDFAIIYNGRAYRVNSASSGTETTDENGVKMCTDTLGFKNYTVTEESTGIVKNLDGIRLFVDTYTYPDGTQKQVIRWLIPSELLPIVYPDVTGSTITYNLTDPIRLVYKVSLTEESIATGGTYYTNSVEEPATFEFMPVEANPYYYDNTEDEDGIVVSSEFDYEGETDNKTENVTGTKSYVSVAEPLDDNSVKVTLGNNGKITLLYDEIEVTKIWEDFNNEGNTRPESISFQLYRNGEEYSDIRTFTAADAVVTKNAAGDDVWSFVIGSLPYSENFTYTATEIPVDGYTTTYGTGGDGLTLTNKVISGKLAYELYLVDKNGNPVDDNGNSVTFENRTVKSELVELNQYLNTTTTLDLDEIEDLLPDGYYIYNPDTSLTEYYNGNASDSGSTVSIVDDTDTTKVFYPSAAQTGTDGTVNNISNYGDIRVTFAIAKIAINPDVIVVDYGKTILCSPLDNDSGATGLVGLSNIETVTTSYTSKETTQNGVFRTEGNNVIFSPFSYMSSINRVRYYATVRSTSNSEQVLNSTIYVIPATLVYYEDDFGGEDENGGLYIKYTGDWYTITDNGTKTEGVTANTDTDDRQDRGEVGQGHVPYGYDSSYDNSVKFSNGNAAMATGKVTLVNGKPQSNATAEFTFTGTGFDIISRTDLDCGMISVVINKHDTGAFYDSVPVINKGVNNLYQIPVISYEGAPYDTYDVKITVNAPSAMLGITGSNFYLDAIRIYNPMGLESDDNAEFDEANTAYNSDKEANAFTQLIRNCLISADKLDVTESYGAVYVDTLDNDYAETGSGLIGNTKSPTYTSEEIRTRAIDLEKSQNFETIGPNEEVYLSPGYGVGFIAETTAIPEAVHLEIKLPAPLNNGATLAAQTYGDTSTIKNITINSATEMYYDITDAVKFTKDGNVYKATVILSNGLNSNLEGDIVAITNLKMTYSDGSVVNGNGIKTSSVSEDQIVTASLKASRETYVQVYDTIYVQHLAATPNYDIVNAEADENVSKGEQVTVEFNTANSVENVTLTAADGKAIELTSLDCDVDESKLYTDDFQNTKSWTATFTAETEGELEYTVSASNGDGETANLMLNVAPAKVVSIKVAKAPAKTNYKYGEKIDTSGLVLEATYSDGSVKQIRSGYTLSTTKANHLGQKTVTVSFDGQTAGFRINTTFSLVSLIKSIFSR